MATIIPAAAKILPFLAVLGLLNIFNPKMKVTDANK
jgi:hypothetical protein